MWDSLCLPIEMWVSLLFMLHFLGSLLPNDGFVRDSKQIHTLFLLPPINEALFEVFVQLLLYWCNVAQWLRWQTKHIYFLKHCILQCLVEYRTVEKVQKASNSKCYTHTFYNINARLETCVTELNRWNDADIFGLQEEDCVLQSLSIPDSKLKADLYNLINALGGNQCLQSVDIR